MQSALGVRFTVSSCIGCGSMEFPRPCVGSCKEQMLDVVPAARHEQACAELADSRARLQPLQRLMARLAAPGTDGSDAERAYRALRIEARDILRETSDRSAERFDPKLVDRSIGWLCVVCGRFEAPQPCLGVCIWHSCEVVRAPEHDDVVAGLNVERGRLDRLTGLARRLAWVTPHEGEWQSSFRALQTEARMLIAELEDGADKRSSRP